MRPQRQGNELRALLREIQDHIRRRLADATFQNVQFRGVCVDVQCYGIGEFVVETTGIKMADDGRHRVCWTFGQRSPLGGEHRGDGVGTDAHGRGVLQAGGQRPADFGFQALVGSQRHAPRLAAVGCRVLPDGGFLYEINNQARILDQVLDDQVVPADAMRSDGGHHRSPRAGLMGRLCRRRGWPIHEPSVVDVATADRQIVSPGRHHEHPARPQSSSP